MIDAIKEVVQNTLKHWGLTDYIKGSVHLLSPLQIKIGDSLLLTDANVIFTQSVGALNIGDDLIILRVMRGQKYILLSKVVKP